MIKDRIILPLVSPNLILAYKPERQGRALQRLLQPAVGRDQPLNDHRETL